MKILHALLVYLILIISMSYLYGCSSVQYARNIEELKQQVQTVNYSDGITEREAIIIAQNYLIDNAPKRNAANSEINIYKVLKSYDLDKSYRIQFDFVFEKKKPFLYPFFWVVDVDKSSGVVLASKFSGNK